MQAPFDNIVQHLFHQPSLHSVTVEELENMARQHPYFAAAHFLLLKKMQDTAHPSFTEQLHKTAIYFNNPLWLQFLLQPETVSNFKVSDTAPFLHNEPAENPAPFREENQAGDLVASESENGPVVEFPAESAMAAPVEAPGDIGGLSSGHTGTPEQNNMMDIITSVFSDPHPLYDTFKTEPPGETGLPAETPVPANHETTTENQDNSDMPEQSATEDAVPASTEARAPEKEAAVSIPAEETGSVADTDTVPVSETPPQPQFEQEPAKAVEDQAKSRYWTMMEEELDKVGPHGRDDASGTLQHDTSPAPEASGEQDDALLAPETKPDAADIPVTAPEETTTETDMPGKTVIETAAAKDDMLFEPYHTVDYFASQGIKLSKTETEPKDKLGRQLKSFTDWLKTMKKLPQASIDKMLAEKEDSKVVEDAYHSIENKEVVTETMAEVFEKQGLYEKAVEIYQKLSLLNPSKSAYFAAKAEALKH